MRYLLTDLIANDAPPRPACFGSDNAWRAWLAAAHESGERIVRRVDQGQGTKQRRTYFRVLPASELNPCIDCDLAHRLRMRAAGRCVPSPVATPPAIGLLGERTQFARAA